MGDLRIEKPSRTGHARLKFVQGLVHEEYLLHLFEKFRAYCGAVPFFIKSLHNKTGKSYPSMRFNTCTFACFNELHDLFYPKKKNTATNYRRAAYTSCLAYFIINIFNRLRGKIYLFIMANFLINSRNILFRAVEWFTVRTMDVI